MDGYLAPLEQICELAEKYGALVMVDDSHAVGFMGASGAGTPEHAGCRTSVDIYTGTFGKALGGASGGYVSGRREIVAMLRQKARPYLFSNSVAPADRRRHAEGAGTGGRFGRTAVPAAGQRRAVPAPDDRGRLRPAGQAFTRLSR